MNRPTDEEIRRVGKLHEMADDEIECLVLDNAIDRELGVPVEIEVSPGIHRSGLRRRYCTDPAASHWLIEEVYRRLTQPYNLIRLTVQEDWHPTRCTRAEIMAVPHIYRAEGPSRLIAIARAALLALVARNLKQTGDEG